MRERERGGGERGWCCEIVDTRLSAMVKVCGSCINVCYFAFPPSYLLLGLVVRDRLVGLVVKASASRAEGPGFESRLRRDCFGVESYL